MTDWMRQMFMLALAVFEGFCAYRLFQAFALPRLNQPRRSAVVIGVVWVLYHGVCLWGNWAFYPSSLWNFACGSFAGACISWEWNETRMVVCECFHDLDFNFQCWIIPFGGSAPRGDNLFFHSEDCESVPLSAQI